MESQSNSGKEILTATDFFSPDEVCALFGIKHSTLKKWTMLNKIPHIKVTRKTFLFPKQVILEHLNQKLVGMEVVHQTPARSQSKPAITVEPQTIAADSSIYDRIFEIEQSICIIAL